MNRRKFFRIAILSVLGAMAASIAAYYSFESIIVKMLKNDLAGMRVNEGDYKKFMEEMQRTNFWKKNAFDWKRKSFLILYFFLPKIGLPYQFKYYQIKGRIVGQFLLSTDFFLNKMDRNQPIKYIGLYDPYLRPCQNPFSNMHYAS